MKLGTAIFEPRGETSGNVHDRLIPRLSVFVRQ